MGIPLSLMAIMGGRDVWITGDRFIGIRLHLWSSSRWGDRKKSDMNQKNHMEADNVSLQNGDSFRKSSKSGFHDSNLVQ